MLYLETDTGYSASTALALWRFHGTQRDFFSMNSNLIKLSFSMDLCQTFPSPPRGNKSTALSPLLSPRLTSDISKAPFYVPNLLLLACRLGTEQHMLWLVQGYACTGWPAAHSFSTAKEAKQC